MIAVAGPWLAPVLITIGVLAALYLAVVIGIVVSIILPNPTKQLADPGPPDRWGLEARSVRIGEEITAWHFPRPDATNAVLVCHGRSRSKRWMLPLIARLAERYEVVAIDFHGHGERGRGTTTIGAREADDVVQAVAWLRERGWSRPFVYGVSMGGAAAIIGLARIAPVGALVTDGTFDALETVLDNVTGRLPIPGFMRRGGYAAVRCVVRVDPRRIRPVDEVAKIGVPALFLHGDADPLVPPACAGRLAEASRGGTAALYRGAHDEPGNREMQDRVVAFLASVESTGALTGASLR